MIRFGRPSLRLLGALFCFPAALYCGVTSACAQVNVLTYQDNNARTGVNPNETVLTPSTVSESTFGLLYTVPVDGQVYAEPLSVAGVNIPGQGVHNVIYVATQNNSVYAFDANGSGSKSAPLWHVNLGPAVPFNDTGAGDIQPLIGITSTPVIRLTGSGTGYIYVLAKTKESSGTGGYNYVQRLHALDITSGAESLNGPTEIQASVNGIGDGNDGNGHVPFNALIQNQRPALLMFASGSTNLIAIGWASHGDNGPYHGWIMTYDATTLKQVSVLNTTPNALTSPSGNPLAAGGIWQGGAGIASDGTNLYLATGNGTFDPLESAYGDSVLKLSPTLKVLDYFTPFDQDSLNLTDYDLGSGGVTVIPKDPVYNPNGNLIVQMGKDGTLHLLNSNNLGQFNLLKDQVLGEFENVVTEMRGNAAYFNGNIYIGPTGQGLSAFQINSGKLVGNGVRFASSNTFGYPGPTPTISSNGSTGGIVWALDTSGFLGSGVNAPAQLWAYDATTLKTLYSSANSGLRDIMGVAVKFAVPLVQGGRVYVGTQGQLDVFGPGKFTDCPIIETAGGTYHNSVTVTVTDAMPNAKIYYTLNGTTPKTSSTVYTKPITLTANASLEVKAWAPGYGGSGVSRAFYQINPEIGSGTGLQGLYFASPNLTGTPLKINTPDVNFDWYNSSPAPGIPTTNWSVEYVGTLQPLCSGYYNFYTITGGGVLLYINGHQVIGNWGAADSQSTQSTAVWMNAGQAYSVRLQYHQNGNASLVKLCWESIGVPLQVIPKTQLYLPSDE